MRDFKAFLGKFLCCKANRHGMAILSRASIDRPRAKETTDRTGMLLCSGASPSRGLQR